MLTALEKEAGIRDDTERSPPLSAKPLDVQALPLRHVRTVTKWARLWGYLSPSSLFFNDMEEPEASDKRAWDTSWCHGCQTSNCSCEHPVGPIQPLWLQKVCFRRLEMLTAAEILHENPRSMSDLAEYLRHTLAHSSDRLWSLCQEYKSIRSMNKKEGQGAELVDKADVELSKRLKIIGPYSRDEEIAYFEQSVLVEHNTVAFDCEWRDPLPLSLIQFAVRHYRHESARLIPRTLQEMLYHADDVFLLDISAIESNVLRDDFQENMQAHGRDFCRRIRSILLEMYSRKNTLRLAFSCQSDLSRMSTTFRLPHHLLVKNVMDLQAIWSKTKRKRPARTGLATVVYDVLQFEVAKEHQSSNWDARPLTPSQVSP